MRFEKKADVQERFLERSLVTQQKSNEQAPQTSNAVLEGMNGLELRMKQRDADQQRQPVLVQ